MAYTAHKDAAAMKEHYDTPEVLSEKIEALVEMIRNSKHFVVFTGAGISTDAGIPDFRGPEGVWTLKAQGKQRSKPTTDTLSAVPTATHMSIVELMNKGILKYLISQNCDGLHRRSGVPPEKISELHGNGNIEYCETCSYEYLRDFHCYRIKHGSKDHFTGRYCVLPGCGGRLMNSTIDFGQNLPVRPLRLAAENSAKADLHLAMGSSLTVSPACNMPKKTAKKGGKLVIINLQKTPLDKFATLRIFHKCDVVMKEVMKRLAVEVPIFRLRRNFAIDHSIKEKNQWEISIRGFDYGTDGSQIPASTIKALQGLLPQEFEPNRKHLLQKEPFRICEKMSSMPRGDTGAILRLHMMGHYAEPPVDVVLKLTDPSRIIVHMTYAPSTGEWTQRRLGDEEIENVGEKEMMQVEAQVRIAPVETSGAVPQPGQWSAGAVALDGNKKPILVTFGGSGIDHEFTPVSCLDLQTMAWTRGEYEDSELPFVSKRRWGHTATVVPALSPSQVFLIGGWDSKSQYNDVHIYDCTSHTLREIKTSGTAPGFRAGHTATAYGKNIIVFGGAVCNGGPYEFYHDVFLLNAETGKWTKLNCKGDLPEARSQHSATLVDKQLIVIGGFTGTKVTSDIYVLDLETLKWTHVYAPTGNPPPTVDNIKTSNFQVFPARHSATLLKTKNDQLRLVVIGPSGVYLLNLADWKWTKPSEDDSEGVAEGTEKEKEREAGKEKEKENEGKGLAATGVACHFATEISPYELLVLGGRLSADKLANTDIYSVSLV